MKFIRSKSILCIMWITLFILVFSVNVYAAAATTPSLVTKINSAFTKIKGYLVKIATPITAVSIASGIIIRKVSFGDEKKMILGKKIIVNAVIGYASIQLLDVIIKFIESVVK